MIEKDNEKKFGNDGENKVRGGKLPRPSHIARAHNSSEISILNDATSSEVLISNFNLPIVVVAGLPRLRDSM